MVLQELSSYVSISLMAITTIEITKNNGENNASILRRFSRAVKDGGTIPKMKSIRYNERPKTKLSTKKNTLNKLRRKAEVDTLKKLGKPIEKKKSQARR